MNKLLFLLITCVLCLCSCKKEVKVTIEKNDTIGIEFDKLLDCSLKKNKDALTTYDIVLNPNDMPGAYFVEETVHKHSVSVILQFWDMNNPDTDNVEGVAEDKLSLVSYQICWQWSPDEYTEEVQKYIRSIYQYYKEGYPPVIYYGNEKEILENGTTSWSTSEDNESPSIEMTFMHDATGASLLIKHRSPKLIAYKDNSK